MYTLSELVEIINLFLREKIGFSEFRKQTKKYRDHYRYLQKRKGGK